MSNEPESRLIYIQNRLYLPMVGVLIVLMEVNWSIFFSWLGKLKKVIPLALILILIVLSLVNIRSFRNDEAFWENAVALSPGLARTHNGLGRVYARRNLNQRALVEHMKAIEISPGEKLINNDIGAAYLKLHQFDKAGEAFLKELEVNPNYYVAYHNLALTLFLQNKIEEAEQYWLAAVELNSRYILPYQGLAVLYAQNGDHEKSIYYINQIVRLGAPLVPELLELKRRKTKTPLKRWIKLLKRW